ncbi:hypothetical protein AV530_007140 [Patagioenas fasciata monilis]|uniref:Uncharacterized protein n=1 Tax=Patagioenas fasciata monilis TaxID=372326 RepID=A0A1V4L1E8_PATFA|nr:hypothetical protein AV530_007140 [Patagioenas fasciata monilis]
MYSEAPCKACNDGETQERLSQYDAFLCDGHQYVMRKDKVAAAEVPGFGHSCTGIILIDVALVTSGREGAAEQEVTRPFNLADEPEALAECDFGQSNPKKRRPPFVLQEYGTINKVMNP